MLKITTALQGPGRQVFHLEGRLAGPWVAMLKGECERALAAGDRLTLELSGVSFADPQGLRLLHELLLLRSVALMGHTPFVAAQLTTQGAGP